MQLPPSTLRHATYRSASGEVTLAYRVFGAGPPILIANGLLSTILHFRAFVAHYARTYSVISWDYPGHGESPTPDAAAIAGAVSIEAFAEQAHAVWLAARERIGGDERPIVCGLSMGVQVALEHYRRHPDDVRALVLLCGTYGHPLNRVTRAARFRRDVIAAVRAAGRSPRLLRAAMAPFVRTPLGRELAYLTGGADRRDCPRSVLDELFAHVAHMGTDVLVASIASYLGHSAEAALDRVAVPTLIVAGGADQLTPPSISERMQGRVRGAELFVVPGRSHLAQVEEPETVHGRIDRFLAARLLAARVVAERAREPRGDVA